MKIAISVASLLLTGCAGFMQPNYGSDMSAAQIAAAGKDKSAAVVCTKIRAAGYEFESVTIMLDQNAIKDGGVSGDAAKGCLGAINSMAPPRMPHVEPPTPVVVPK